MIIFRYWAVLIETIVSNDGEMTLLFSEKNKPFGSSKLLHHPVIARPADFVCLLDPDRSKFKTTEITSKWESSHNERSDLIIKKKRNSKGQGLQLSPEQYLEYFPCLCHPLGIVLVSPCYGFFYNRPGTAYLYWNVLFSWNKTLDSQWNSSSWTTLQRQQLQQIR